MAFDATGTIGSLPCEVALNQLLAVRNDPKLIKGVVQLLKTAKFRFKQLNQMTDESSKYYFFNLYQEQLECDVQRITGHPTRSKSETIDAITSHTMCCIHAYYGSAREQK